MPGPTAAFRQVIQLGIVVRDVDACVERYKALLGVGDAQISRIETRELPSWLETRYRGKPSEFHARIALIDFGGLQFELIEPLAGDPSCYSEFLETVGQGIQHIMVQPTDHAELTRTLEANETELINQGRMYGGEFRYYDLSDDLGFVLELYDDMSDEYVQRIVATGAATTDRRA